MINPWIFFLLLLKGSLFSTGGLSNLPIVYDDLLARGWADDRQFTEALAVGKISPGPTGLWVLSLGYLVHGLPGALLALLALTLPPMLVLVFDKVYRRIGQHPVVQGFVWGLSLAVVGIFAVIVVRMVRDHGIDAGSVSILLASLWLGSIRRIPFVVLLAGAGVVGVLLYLVL